MHTRRTGSQVSLSCSIVAAILLANICAGQQDELQFQQQQQQQQSTRVGGTTLVIRQNANGDGISVIDRNTNQQLISTSGQGEVNANEMALDDQEDMVVAGLLEWLKKKKREKEEKKNKGRPNQPIILPVPIPQPQPMPMPYPPQPNRHERKEIHIHINNHIKKDGKKHHGGKKHGGGGHYEDYHDGHYSHDYHDKYYQGKHSFPLLGHHLSFDHYGGGGGGGDHYAGGDHHQHDHHDDYSGYESRGVAQYATATAAGDGKRKASAAGSPTKRASSRN